MRIAALMALILIWLPAHAGDSLSDGRSGSIAFSSYAPRGHFELSQATFDRKPVAISGQLLLPPGEGKVPAVVIGHAAGGVVPVLSHRWARAFNEAGYAAFIVDSFGPRGLASVHNKGASEFNGAFLISDAFMALQLLATHPRVDAARIAYVGFSMGGGTAQFVIHERFRKAVLGVDSPLRFAASVAHYPICHYNFVERQASPVPLFVFLGGSDDWTRVAPCQDYLALLGARGYRVSSQVYEGASHGYDMDEAAHVLSDANNMGGCEPLVVDLDEPVLAPRELRSGAPLLPGADTRAAALRVYQWGKACTKQGATIGVSGGGGDRRREAVVDTLKALARVFAPRP